MIYLTCTTFFILCLVLIFHLLHDPLLTFACADDAHCTGILVLEGHSVVWQPC